MSAFWSGWVKFLVIFNLGVAAFLFAWSQRVRIPTLPDGTTGHSWAHGVLREGVRALPRWWVLFSATMFIVGFIYLVLYPGFGSYEGALGWTSAKQLERDVAVNDAKLRPTLESWRSRPIRELAADAAVTAIGSRLYADNCAACHGRSALGNQAIGAPNLTDDVWLYGDDEATLLASILDGRGGVMPAWGAALGRDGVNQVSAYVLSLGGYSAPEDWVSAGKAHFAAMCAACHGQDGRGSRAIGAPDLTDDVWLYGGDFAAVAESVRNGRNGVMPAWRERLGEDQVRAVAAWVYAQRGGGA
ncbi:MAG TPA: c-type cytochrome [Steroidobacter sp.]|jgi:cytochrome c oxidase cbb3-type subunit 3|nr:c-type cytochrome [Steroidobacteraceae bacterium]HLS82004.1 c-type cytochrome [Steroidobacter sp.]